LSILILLEPLSDLVLVEFAELLVCMCTGIKAGLQAIPSLEKRRDWYMILDIL
jgi:hypothetical protein